MTEWDLLVAADDVEPGDTLDVDTDGDIVPMVLRKCSKGVIYLSDVMGTVKKFSVINLEEIDGDGYIVGLSDLQMSIID